MVEYHTCKITSPSGISSIIYILFFTAANANEAHNDIVTIRAYGVVAKSDAGVGSRLSKNGGVCSDRHIAG